VERTPLRQRNFGLLWWAGLISLTGNWILAVALPVHVLRLTGSPAAVSAVVAAGLAGNLLFGTVAGAYVDRWDRRRVVVAVNVLQTVTVLPLLLADDPGRVWIVALVAFASSALTQFFNPAENALLPQLVPPQQLTAANSLNSLNNNLGRLIGPALGGLAVTTIGLTGAALLDAVSYAVAAVLCGLITGRYRAKGAQPRRHLLRELAEGLSEAGRNRIVRGIFVLIAVIMVGEGMMSTLFAVFVTRSLGGGGEELGWFMSAQAIGGITGSLLATRVVRVFRPVPFIAASFTVTGVINLIIFNYPRVSTQIWPLLVFFVLVGIPVGIHVVALWTLFQGQTPDRLRGRAFSAIWTGGALAGILGAAVAGWLGATVSAVNVMTAQTLLLMSAGGAFRLIAGPGPATLTPPASEPSGPPPAPGPEPNEVSDPMAAEHPVTNSQAGNNRL
jgi:MFS family permease